MKAGKKAKFRVRVKNIGDANSRPDRVCIKGPASGLCARELTGVASRRARPRSQKISVRIPRRVKKGKLVKVRVAVKAKGAKTVRGKVRVRVK